MRCAADTPLWADGGHSTTRQLAGIGFPGARNDDVVARIVEVAVPADLVDTATATTLPGRPSPCGRRRSAE